MAIHVPKASTEGTTGLGNRWGKRRRPSPPAWPGTVAPLQNEAGISLVQHFSAAGEGQALCDTPQAWHWDGGLAGGPEGVAQWGAGSHVTVLVGWPPECVLNKPASPSLLGALPKAPPQATRHSPLPPLLRAQPLQSAGPGPPSHLSPSLSQALTSATPLPEVASQAPMGLEPQSLRVRFKPDLLRGLGQSLSQTPHPPSVVTCSQLCALSARTLKCVLACPLTHNMDHTQCPEPQDSGTRWPLHRTVPGLGMAPGTQSGLSS